MKYYYTIGLIVVLLILLVFAGCAKNNENRNQNEKEIEHTLIRGAVFINGEMIEDLPVFVGASDFKDVRLPFMQIVQSLGMTVERKDDGLVHITNGDDLFVLHCASDIVLVKQGWNFSNLLSQPPGSSSYYCQYEMNDVFLNSETLAGALYLMGLTIHMSFDYEIPKIEIVMIPT